MSIPLLEDNGLTVKAFIPGVRYSALSITGDRCALNCKYCMGHYLKGMVSASSPKHMYDVVRGLKKRGARGILVSGGFDPEGKLPVKSFLPVLREIKRDFDLVISIHCGLVDRELAKEIRRARVDIADYELIMDPLVIREVMRLKSAEPTNFVQSLKWLLEDGPPYIAPHIPIGLRYGEIENEWEAVDVAADFDPPVTVFLTFIPTRETLMEDFSPPPESEIVNLLKHSRTKFREIAMGCMRPWKYRSALDLKLIEMDLVDRIAVPRKSVIEKYNLEVIHSCCSVPKELIEKFL